LSSEKSNIASNIIVNFYNLAIATHNSAARYEVILYEVYSKGNLKEMNDSVENVLYEALGNLRMNMRLVYQKYKTIIKNSNGIFLDNKEFHNLFNELNKPKLIAVKDLNKLFDFISILDDFIATDFIESIIQSSTTQVQQSYDEEQ